MFEHCKRNQALWKAAALILFFVLLFIAAVIRFWPSFGFADLSKAEPVYKQDKLYYNHLSRKEQYLYDALITAIDLHKDYTDEIRYVFSSEEFNNVVQFIISDYPEYFYVDYNHIESYVSETHTKVKLAYYKSKEEATRMQAELQNAIAPIIEQTVTLNEDFEKELLLHDYLVESCTYLTGEPDNAEGYLYNTAYGAIVLKKAYCDGYALAFKLLMNQSGLFCSTVSGFANNLPHMWNMVYIDDHFYHVDVTWNDADMTYGKNMIFHGYFNLSKEAITYNHIISYEEVLPLAEDETNYYERIGLSAHTKEELTEILYNSMTKALDQGLDYFEIGLNYEEATNDFKALFADTVEQINREGAYTVINAHREYECSYDTRFLNIEFYRG
ncbi:MAG: hypothetical protein HFE77_07955 [Clostridiales bacterium]|nr:hypothetical protein [Clostridiales bacterium]